MKRLLPPRGWRNRWCGVCMLSVGLAFQSALATELKVGVVDVTAIIDSLPERQAVENDLSQRFDALRKEVDTRWQDVANLSKELESIDGALSEQGVTEHQEELIKRETALSEYWNATSEKIRAETSAASEKLSRRVEEAVERFARDNGFDLIFDRSSGKLVYSAERFDQTDNVLHAVLGASRPAVPSAEDATKP